MHLRFPLPFITETVPFEAAALQQTFEAFLRGQTWARWWSSAARVCFERRLPDDLPAIRECGEPAARPWMHGVVPGPRPAAELVSSIIVVRGDDFVLRVHHERAVLGDGLANRPSLEQ